MSLKVAAAIYTYDRVDDARINMELIRGVWEKSDLLGKVLIIHSFNGEHNWYPEQYLEDRLIRIQNRGHFPGAADLIESGVNMVLKDYDEIDYVITLAADTWLLNLAFVKDIIDKMESENKYVAASCWGNPYEDNPMKVGLSTDLFIVNKSWAKKTDLFPLKYDDFYGKYFEVLMYQSKTIFLERIFSLRFFQSAQKHFGSSVSDHILETKKDELLYRISEREPVHNSYADLKYRKAAPLSVKMKRFFNLKYDQYRNMYWPEIELLTHHDPVQKQKDLLNHKYPDMQFTKKFVESKNLDYFNNIISG